MKRKENESFEDYKKRRSEDNIRTNRRLKGINVWPSEWGTYSSKKDGAIETRLKSIMDKMTNERKTKDIQSYS